MLQWTTQTCRGSRMKKKEKVEWKKHIFNINFWRAGKSFLCEDYHFYGLYSCFIYIQSLPFNIKFSVSDVAWHMCRVSDSVFVDNSNQSSAHKILLKLFQMGLEAVIKKKKKYQIYLKMQSFVVWFSFDIINTA